MDASGTQEGNHAHRPSKFDRHFQWIKKSIEQGKSMAQIARELNCTDVGVADYARRRGLIRRKTQKNRDKVLTIHPEGKPGVYIDKSKYTQVRKVILQCFRNKREVIFSDLKASVEKKLSGKFDGSINWYFNLIKLDLEARGELVRTSEGSPQTLALGQ